MEFDSRGIPALAKRELVLHFKGNRLEQRYQPDFVCYDRIIVELKAVNELADEHRAQVHNYLKAAKLELGLLVNFGHYPKAQVERIVR